MLLAIGRWDTCLLSHLKRRSQYNQEMILRWKKKIPLQCPLSPSSESIGETDEGEDFTNEEVYVLDATSPPEEMVTATFQQLQSMLSNDVSPEEKDEFLEMFKDFTNLFVISYHDLRHVTAIENAQMASYANLLERWLQVIAHSGFKK